MSEQGTLIINTPAPDIALVGSSAGFSLAHYRGKYNVLLYFMREFNCPICRGHVAELNRLYSQFKTLDTEIVVIGGGENNQAEKISQQLNLSFPVLADTNHSLYSSFGLEKAFGMLQRSGTIVIDKTGIVHYILEAALPLGSFNRKGVLSALKELNSHR